MSIDSDLYTATTAHLVELLANDAEQRLTRGVDHAVGVHTGPHHSARQLGENQTVYVWRSRIGADFWMGAAGLDVDVVYALQLRTKVVADPEEMERQMSALAANVLAIVADARNEAGYWTIRAVGPSQVYTELKDRNRVAEIEMLPVGLKLSGVDL